MGNSVIGAQDVQYGITSLNFGTWPFIEISAEEYSKVREAKARLVVMLRIEEKLDLLLANYVEFERELLDMALDQMVFGHMDYSSGRDAVQRTNRRILNVLAAGRLYDDQLRHDVRAVYGRGSELVNKLKQATSKQYDASFSYRAVVALRNYVQHRSLPVHKLNSWTTSEGCPQELVFRVTPSLVVSQIGDDRFKKPVLEELRAKGPEVDLTLLLRGYIEAVGEIHEAVRSLTVEDASDWQALVEGVLQRASESKLDGLVGIVTKDETGRWVESHQVFPEMIDRWKSLVEKNRWLRNLSDRHVSGSCRDVSKSGSSRAPTTPAKNS